MATLMPTVGLATSARVAGSLLALLMGTAWLAGCGQKGPLTRPIPAGTAAQAGNGANAGANTAPSPTPAAAKPPTAASSPTR
jgi:predicted small lipoprotein YifL